jgi:tryptophanyl-tRNA synthetase
VQHIEMARDFAQRFNHLYGDLAANEYFVLPEAVIEEQVATLPGLDGRKMSKSYDNTIALFAPRAELKKQILSIVTDSRLPGEPKEVEGSALFQIYQSFATPEETQALRKAYADGIAWSDAKQLLFERIDREIGPMRERYEALMANPAEIERILQAGAHKARAFATPFLAELREAVGLRNLASQTGKAKADKSARAALPSFKQYREADGRFYFKLVDAKGRLLLQSTAFNSAKDAGMTIANLRKSPASVATAGALGEGVSIDDAIAALERMAASD